MNLNIFGWRYGTAASEAFSALLQAQEGADLALGRVILEQRGCYRLMTELGEVMAEVTGHFQYQAETSLDYPAVGDWVAIRLHDQNSFATIQQLLPRHSQFVRKAAGSPTAGQVVAANVDTVVLMLGLDGDYNLRRIERYLVLAWESGAQPVIALNKLDLRREALTTYIADLESVAIGVPVHAISAATGEGLAQLEPYLRPEKTVVLLGSSGAGKSTLTNQLLGANLQATQAIRLDDSKGRHTTTARHLLLLPSGALLIDTPGMRELQLWSSARGLTDTFDDLVALAQYCKFTNCQHRQEPGCAIQAAIATGALDPKRLGSYQKLQREQQWLSDRQDHQAKSNTKRRWKQLTQDLRQRNKHHREN